MKSSEEDKFKAVRERLLEGFGSELGEHLESLRQGARQLGERSLPERLFEDMLRRLHSLKGATRMVGLVPLEKLIHALETLLIQVSRERPQFSPDQRDQLVLVLDSVEDWFYAYRENWKLPAVEPSLEILAGLLGGPLAPAAPTGERSGPPLEAGPALEAAFASESPDEGLSGDFNRPAKMVRLHTDTLDRMLRTSVGLVGESLRQESLSRDLGGIRTELTRLLALWDSTSPALAGPMQDQLEEFTGALQALSRRLRQAQTTQRDSSTHLTLLGNRLQNEIRVASTVAASDLFSGLGTMVRELARSQGKDVVFEASGLEIEAERRVLQELLDPLVHLLRNAVHHGVEPSAEPGQDRRAKVWLRLVQRSGMLEVEVGDDGKGMDRDALRGEAERLGLATAAELGGRDDASLLNLAFHPHLSTSGQVSEVAGRGMGMSIVHETARRLGGEAWIESPGRGTLVRMRVPTTLSSMSVLLLETAGRRYALPSSSIQLLLSVEPDQLEKLGEKPALSLGDGALIPVVALGNLLGLGQELSAPLSLVVLRVGDKRLGVIVDEWSDHREVVVQSLNLPQLSPAFLMGGTILPAGEIAFVLNPTSLVSGYRPEKNHGIALTSAPVVATAPKAAPVILVVDDSLTTRALQKGVLETHGYSVLVATNGLEALEVLRAHPVDLIVTDIQMPRMDGFGLLESIKKSPELGHLPVILMSSLDQPEEIQRGLRTGADAYIIKAQFEQRRLLELIEQLL